MGTCSSCGEYTTSRNAFGDALCSPCYDAEDDAVEAAERRTAMRHGYDREHYRERDAAQRLARVVMTYECDVEDAQRFIDLRDEGHSTHAAAVMAGLRDAESDG